MKITGEFLPSEIQSFRDAVHRAHQEIDRLENEITRRRALAATGANQAKADTIEAAMRVPAFLTAIREYDKARAARELASKQLRACRSRGYRMTDLALERSNAHTAATGAVNAAVTRIRLALPPGSSEALLMPMHHNAGLEYALTSDVRSLREALVTTGLERDLESAKQRLVREEAILAAAEPNMMSDKRLRSFARILTDEARKLLVELVGGYHPKPKTIASNPQPYDDLVRRGLLERHQFGGVITTRLGKDVVAWVAENMPQVGVQRDESMPGVLPDLYETFDRDTVRRLRSEALNALEEVKARKDETLSSYVFKVEDDMPCVMTIPADLYSLRFLLARLGQNTKDAKRGLAKLIPQEPEPYVKGIIEG